MQMPTVYKRSREISILDSSMQATCSGDWKLHGHQKYVSLQLSRRRKFSGRLGFPGPKAT